jgi:hypothetical protein
MKSNINSVEAHPQLSNNGHLVDGALVGAGSLWPSDPTLEYIPMDGGSSLLQCHQIITCMKISFPLNHLRGWASYPTLKYVRMDVVVSLNKIYMCINYSL